MLPAEKIISQRMALRPEHIRAGFEIAWTLSENCWLIRRRGLFYRRFGAHTPMAVIHADLDACIEMEKAVTMAPFRIEDFSHADKVL